MFEMTETEALYEIAKAINSLASNVGAIGFILFLFLILKNMGASVNCKQ